MSWSLWTDRHKVIVRTEWSHGRAEAVAVHGEVYDLDEDPGEQRNVARSGDPAVLAAIRRFEEVHTDLWRISGRLRAGQAPFDSDEERAYKRLLAEIGYVASRPQLDRELRMVQDKETPPPAFPERP